MAEARQGILIRVEETAGIRRFQYPVAAEVELPQAVARDTCFRLLRGGEPVLAQVRAAEPGGAVARWWIDFPVDLLPYKSLGYELEYGDAPEGPGRKQGLKLIPSADRFRVANEPHIAWTVPRDLGGLLQSVLAGEIEYFRPGPGGLLLRDADGKDHPIGGGKNGVATNVSVTREGPLAIGLRFEIPEAGPALAQVRSTVDLVFPVFKSWVEVDWRIQDPQGKVRGAGARVQVNLDAPTPQAATLIDYGATGLVYLSLGPGQRSLLTGHAGAWQVLRGVPERMEPFVFGPERPDNPVRPEGWAHVMDRRRCLAVAVHRFADAAEDRIAISADGLTELHRPFPARVESAAAPKRLRFWLHCVPFPPQQTAATSPQAMQNPVVTAVQDRAAPPR
ncbi:MAG: hypothetical protein HUU20_13565 [Pirellulales bacterium]|nr:hypothetical protein [Pirellulales bacterium]